MARVRSGFFRRISAALTRVLVLCSLAAPACAAAGEESLIERFQAAEYHDAGSGTLRYRLFVPPDLEPGRKYPLVLYLHGITAVGDDNRQQVLGPQEVGARVWAEPAFQSAHPCFVLAPQCPFGTLWANPFTRKPTRKLRAVHSLLDELARSLPLDPDRLYVTGQSMGGFGTWALITAYPDRFAAAAPVCGGGSTRGAALLARTPVWAFHGALDPLVLAHESRRMVAAIRKAGGNPRYTEFPLTMHQVWKRTYSDPALGWWMFAQNRAGATPAGQ